MMKHLFALLMLLLSAFGLQSAALAASVAATAATPEVAVTLTVFKVVKQADGSEALVAGDAGPGDTVEYQVRYNNAGSSKVQHLLATLPIPASGMEYLAAGVSPSNVEASTDGVSFAAVPLKRSVTGADGKVKIELVPTSHYRVLRWDLGDLPPGKVATVRSRMRLNKFSNPLATTTEVK